MPLPFDSAPWILKHCLNIIAHMSYTINSDYSFLPLSVGCEVRVSGLYIVSLFGEGKKMSQCSM